MRKKLLTFLLVMALITGILAGCAVKNTEEVNTSGGNDVAAAEEKKTGENEQTGEDNERAEEKSNGPGTFYACEEETEITVLFQFPAFFQGFFPDGWSSSDFWGVLEEKTNTIWTLTEVSNAAWKENVNLLCAAGDLPDVVTGLGNVYPGGIAGALRDEMIYDISEIVIDSAPNYFNSLSRDDYSLKTTLTDDGAMGAMYALLEEPYPITSGLWIRQDWLDQVGEEIPTTTEELKNALELFRDECGADLGLYQMITTNTGNAAFTVEGVWNAFGPCNFWYDTATSQIQYGPMQDYYYDYLNYLKSLAKEDLFLTSDMTELSDEQLVQFVGIQGDMPDNIPAHEAMLENENGRLVPMTAIGEPTEYGPVSSIISSDAGGNISISTNCSDPAVVLKALDYLFTEEGALLSSYGIEGTTYNVIDGEPVLTELVTNNPEGIPARAAMGYFLNPGIPGLIDYARSQSAWSDVQRSSYGIWEAAYSGSSMTVDVNSLTLTEEEQDAIAIYKSDMITYVSEWANAVVFGDKEITETEINDFRSAMIETMHIDEMLEIYNNAYLRFQSRSIGE